MPGHSTEELQETLDEIIKKTGTMRTLEEILMSYKRNQMAHEKKADVNKPKKARRAYHIYYEENKEKLIEKYKRETGDKFNYLLALKFAKEKFDGLSDKKKQPYLDKHQKQVEEYTNAMQQYKRDNPEYFAKKAKKEKVADPNVPTVTTPFTLFRAEKCQENSYWKALELWKELSDVEKVDYIKRVLNSKDEHKKISIGEKKILDEHDGIPKKPQGPFILFGADFRANFTGDRNNMMKLQGEAWKNLSEKKRKQYEDKYNEAMVEYGKTLEKYIESLPSNQQVTMRMTLKKYLPKPVQKTATFRETGDGSPAKKKMKIEKTDSSVPSTPEKSQKSPKKDPKTQVALPPYPSETTAHFYMMTVHDGDRKKARKGYKKLSAHEKKAYQKEMTKVKQQFLAKTSDLFKKISPSQASVEKAKFTKYKEQQKEEIDWHKPAGTDDEVNSSSGSEDGSDSDES